ncbi:MAG: CDP-diacylglycerol--glycerol-3-phosphate 3-phosphatidyltransferase [Halothiobacillaceae bacterium]|nr:CDP-diacylglycerol--glycerol-3-phosphate 3-phosphatidyltransferase [Halothiobacillaceae bacterium]
MPVNLPNLLTWLRIVLIPVFVGVFLLPFSWAGPLSAAIFALASITDALDGYLARRLNQQSRFGAFLDPVADKLIVVAALVLLVQVHGHIALTVASIIIIGREIVISALREWMAEIGRRASVAVSGLGKLKTIAQMGAIFFMLYEAPFAGLPLFQIGEWLLYIAALLTVVSAGIYLRAAAASLKGA